MKIYTRSGDKGQTSLFTGNRVLKSHLRIEAYGMVDELNSWLGLIKAALPEEDIRETLTQIQNELFELGADLATPEDKMKTDKHKTVPRVREEAVLSLEKKIDDFTEELPPLRHFIIPGGTEAGSRFHIARCVCRRTERVVVSLMAQESLNPHILEYLNRLSDLLFILARVSNHRRKQPESQWIPQKP
jgi:cob(I)alamin adenosyltransferase